MRIFRYLRTDDYLLIAAVFALFILIALFARAFRARGRIELRCQLLELLALAADRGLPLLPVLERLRDELRSKRRAMFQAVIEHLERGAPLSEALARHAPRFFPPQVTACMHAAEGGAHFPDVLRALARGAARTLSAHHRVLLALAYPALLGGVFLLLPFSMKWMDSALGTPAQGIPALAIAEALVWIILGALAFALMLHCWPTRAFGLRACGARIAALIPPFSGFARLIHAERVLRALAPPVATGEPLSRALQLAGQAAGDPRRASAAEEAARASEAGEPADRVWSRSGLPAFVAIRAAAASAKAPAAFARVLDALAEECAARFDGRLERCLRWMQPLSIAFFGLFLALQFRGIFDFLDRVRIEEGLW